MLSIRPEQLDALREASLKRFFASLRGHARRYFPQARDLDDAQLDSLSAHAVERAAAHGIEGEREISLWLNLMFVFGTDFDVDPSMPWAAAALAEDAAPGPRIRMSRLYRAAMKAGSQVPEQE